MGLFIAMKTWMIFLGLFLISVALYTNKFFGLVTLDQVISTLTFGYHGVIAGDSIFIKRFIEWCVFWPSLATIAIVIFVPRKFVSVGYLLLFIGIGYDCYQFQLIDYCKHLYKPRIDFFESHYVNPKQVVFTAQNPKSLVLIYVESLESTFSDKTLFGHDLLHALNDIKGNILSFKNFQQAPGTGWTIAGLISTQCAIPLKSLTIFGGNRIGENINSFLPNAKCLGDILTEHGYKNVFLNGSSLTFGGKGQFIRNHHYEAYGKDEWLAKGIKPDEMLGWGLPDDVLFREARLKLDALMKQKQPFNLTILTVDTHGIEGQLNKSCRKKGYRGFAGIVECTADEVADFIHYIQDQDWLKSLNVVVLGDHLVMKNLVSDKLERSSHRTIFNLFLTDKPLKQNTNDLMHFDLLPTILTSLGFSYTGDRVGLGYSGIGNNKARSDNRFTEIANNIEYNSSTYNQLWLS